MSTAKKQPAKRVSGRVTPKKVSSASEWKKGSGAGELEVPSGNVALVRNPGIQAFVTAGLLPNSLMPIVTEALERGKPPSMSAFQEGVKKDPKLLAEMLESIDKLTVHCVVEPKVYPVPTEVVWNPPDADHEDQWTSTVEAPQLKDPDRLYVDEVDLDDKMFIFQWAVGGTRDLERFRKQYGSGVADVQRSRSVGGTAKRTRSSSR